MIEKLNIFPVASAHEAYVLDHNYFQQELQTPSDVYIFDALKNSGNPQIPIFVTVGVLTVCILRILFRRSAAGTRLSQWLNRAAPVGKLALRLAVAASFFF